MPDAATDLSVTPLPLPHPGALVILVGGTFDPPHRGHVELPLRARDRSEQALGIVGHADLLYIPAARSPHKDAAPAVSDADRVHMLRLALRPYRRAAVWTDEIDRAARNPGAPSFTADTIARARRWLDHHGHAATRLRLLIGADQALAFHRWREPHRIIAMADPIVLLRPPISTRAALEHALRAAAAWSDAEIRQWGERVVDVGVIDASATAIRQELAAPMPNRTRLESMLDPTVLDYIAERGLYDPH